MGSYQRRRQANQVFWYAFTPAGTLVMSTGAPSKQQCIDKLLAETAHMPYKDWNAMYERGYRVEQIPNLHP